MKNSYELSKVRAQSHYNHWVNFLKTIPVVYSVDKCAIKDGDVDLLTIRVIANLSSFLNDYDDENDQKAAFYFRENMKIDFASDGGVSEDEIFKNWVQDEYTNIDSFCKALINLCELYEKAVPVFKK